MSLIASPTPTTEYEAQDITDILDEWVIVANRVACSHRDTWVWTFQDADIRAWRHGIKAGRITTVQQRRGDNVVLLAKVAR